MRVASYRIVAELAGGQFEAEHVVLPRRAILKTVPEALGFVKPLRVAVVREACILEALQHPGIPRLYETGLCDDGRPWFAYEDIDGTAISELRRPLGLAEVIALVRDLTDILEHAHRRGIIHGGLHPDRIVMTERAFPVCIDDWSTARPHDAAAPVPSLPRVDALRYTAPEHATGAAIDDRADIYSLGAIARTLLPASVPVALFALIAQMTAEHPWDRPSASEVRDALERIPVTLLRPRWTPAFGVAARRDDVEELTQEDVILVELS
ncbi:MAG TPA: protein kinase [Kofleriaceae bacterium]|nr:protein kinase [Kofleriaceae bacterium]